MRNTKESIYLKIILTIIATCLIWICIRDIKISPPELQAEEIKHHRGIQEVRIVDISATSLSKLKTYVVPNIIDVDFVPLFRRLHTPIKVKVTNWDDFEKIKK